MNFKNFLGWLIFSGGLAIILFALYSSWNIFTAKKLPPEIFKFEEKRLEISLPKGKSLTKESNFQQNLGKIVGEQLKNLLPMENLTKILNLFSWSILAGILIFGGSQIASLGIKLLKK
jgi:hypothetical protein